MMNRIVQRRNNAVPTVLVYTVVITCYSTGILDDRINKASKCVYSIRNALSHNSNISVPLAMTLFDKQVSPILLYGCTNWAPNEVNTMLYF